MPSKKANKKYSYRPQDDSHDAPPLVHEWDLSKYYESLSDPAIEQDLVKVERAYQKFAKRYTKRDFTQSPAALQEALDEYLKLLALRASKPLRYLHFRTTLNAHDEDAAQRLNQLQSRVVKFSNQVLFFSQTVARIPKQRQKAMLRAKDLQPYRYWLQKLFTRAPHLLSLEVEQVLRRKSLPAHDLWVRGTEQILGQRTIAFRKETMPLLGAIEQVSSVDNKTRPQLWKVITQELEALSEVAANELQAIVLDADINDDLRDYDVPYAATVEGYENERASVEQLVDTISTTGFSLSKRFYRTKAQLHGLSQLTYVDRFREIGNAPHFSYEDSVMICRDVFYGLRTEYGELFDRLVSQGHVDVFPRAGKQGGAFMASGINEPIMVKLNHTNDLGSLMTLAHEMGHAIHTHRTHQTQPVQYQGYSTVTAETASTFFERAVWQALYDQADEATKTYLLHYKISNDIATMQRQIAFFNFELAMHQTIRAQGGMSKQALAQQMQQDLQAYMGPSVNVTEADGYSYVYVGHFRMLFYVYAYAYGHLMSEVMFAKLQTDNNYIEAIDRFLGLGHSMAVEDIFRSIDIDPTDPATFKLGLQSLQKDITRLQKRVK